MYSYIHTCKSLDPKLLDARARAELPHLLSSSSAWTLAEDPPLKGAEVLVCYQLCKHRRIARLELHISYHGLPAYAKVRKYWMSVIIYHWPFQVFSSCGQASCPSKARD